MSREGIDPHCGPLVGAGPQHPQRHRTQDAAPLRRTCMACGPALTPLVSIIAIKFYDLFLLPSFKGSPIFSGALYDDRL